jgi:hypothetical protein
VQKERKNIENTQEDMLKISIENGAKYTATLTPDGILRIESMEDDANEEDVKSTASDEKEVIIPQTFDETKPIKSECFGEVVGENKKQLKDYDQEEVMVMLDDVGGDVYNPLFYNAVRHICETQYFPINGVYTYREVEPNECDIVILLPNVWGKITGEFIEIYEKYLKDGGKLFVINPETFECIEIKTPENLWDFEMSIIQEEMI